MKSNETQDMYIVELSDYSAPAMISGATKEYVGNKADIERIVNNSGPLVAKEVRILAEVDHSYYDVETSFRNVFGFDHSIKVEELKVRVLYLQDDRRYMRCIKAEAYNLEVGINRQGYYCPEVPMGDPNVVYESDGWLRSHLFTIETEYSSKQECFCDISHPSDIDFSCFFRDIFGDG